jgi:hypothetical protein
MVMRVNLREVVVAWLREEPSAPPPPLSARQTTLLRRGGRLVTAMAAMTCVGLALWALDGLDPFAWMVAVVEAVLISALVITGRALTRSGSPFNGVRWWRPSTYRGDEPRPVAEREGARRPEPPRRPRRG